MTPWRRPNAPGPHYASGRRSGRIAAPTPVGFVLKLGHVNGGPSLAFRGVGPPVGWRVLAADLELVDLPHVENRNGLGVIRCGDGDHLAAVLGSDQAPGIPSRSQLASRYPHARIQRDLADQ